MVTTNFGGRLGNILLEVYTCFWYAKYNNIDFSKIAFKKHFDEWNGANPEIFHKDEPIIKDYILKNKDIFENFWKYFLEDKEYDDLIKKEHPTTYDSGRITYDICSRIKPKNVIFKKYAYHYPETTEDVTLFKNLFHNKHFDEQKEKFSSYFENENNVALHIRRTDYKVFQKGKFLESESDIQKKIDKYENATIVVFSDDLDWCKENITAKSNNLVFHENQEIDCHDVMLMSQFKNIEGTLASSFSYCAKLLDPNITEVPSRF